MALTQNEVLKVHGSVALVVVEETTINNEGYHVGLKPDDLVNLSQWIRITALIEAKIKASLSKASRLTLSVSFAEETVSLSFNDIGSDVIRMIEKSIEDIQGAGS